MFEVVRRFFGIGDHSAATAKERLRLVLMTDHLAIAPEIVEAMKRDLVEVISQHVEVDRDRIEVSFEQQDRALAMLANIPILSVNRPAPKALPPGPPPTRPRRRRRRKNAARRPGTAEAAAAT
jgi:cell division topological specificity factor